MFKLIYGEKYESVEKTNFSLIKRLKTEIERLKLRKEKLHDTFLDRVIASKTFKERDKLIDNII